MARRYTVLLLVREYPGGGTPDHPPTTGGSGNEGSTQLASGTDLDRVATNAIHELRILVASVLRRPAQGSK